MDAKKTRDVSAQLEGVRRQFERWRKTRKTNARIPDSLWDAAVRMADRHGVSRTAGTLKINYQTLKRRWLQQGSLQRSFGRETTVDALDGEREAEEAARFVELTPFASVGSGECFLEWEDAAGAKKWFITTTPR